MALADPIDLDRAIADLRGGGPEANAGFEQIFRAYHRLVVGYYERHGVSPEEARDLAQEVFLVVHGSIGALKDAASFRSWLFGIARNKLLRHIEKKQRERETIAPESADREESQTERYADPHHGALDQILDSERRVKLREALEELPQQMRACVKLSVVEELEYSEIASRLGVSVNSVKVHIHRARHNLAARLGPLFKI